MKYRKKPVEIEALEVIGLTPEEVEPIMYFCRENALYTPSVGDDDSAILVINTLEGPLNVSKGDMIIKGVNGEFYPCKPDIFEKTYDLATDTQSGVFPSPHGSPEPHRFRLPDTRSGPTVKFNLTEDGVDEKGNPITITVDGYFTVNVYPDGMPGEIWITMNKPGYPIQGLANCWAIAMSMLLQFGVHPQKLYDKFKWREFQPNGISGVPSVPMVRSVVDLIVRWMEANMAPTARPVNEDDQAWMKAVEEVVR